MNKKIRTIATVSALALLMVTVFGQTVRAETSFSPRFSSASYVPGDSGTFTYYITNTSPTTISLKNLTFYFPWAGYDASGKWQGNVSINFSPWKTLVTNPAGGNVTYYNQVAFQVPSWYGALAQNHECGNGKVRYGIFVGCVLIGTDQDTIYQHNIDLSVAIAQAVYIPTSASILSTWVPAASLVVLIIATAILALVLVRLGNLPKKS
jgi:hypothetical protein